LRNVSEPTAAQHTLAAPAPAPCDWQAVRLALLEGACTPYRRVGRFAYHFARGKLGADPVFRAILEQGLLRGCRRILDLGCGQGLLAAWLQAAAGCHRRGPWPHAWPVPPAPESVRGIELMVPEVRRARGALGPACEILHGDIRSSPFGSADAVIALDVLHYLAAEAQQQVLRRAHAALPQGGVLLLRVGDAGGGARFRVTLGCDRVVLLLRGHGVPRLTCRRVDDWQELLQRCGFDSRAQRMSVGTPFANVLLIAHSR
jgi:SAM-dependent methyltransferase